MKTHTIAAALLIAGTAGIAIIGATEAAPKIAFNFICWPHFTQNGSGGTYGCSQNFAPSCAKGLQSAAPTLTKIGTNLWRVSYGCYKPPA